MLAIDTNLVVRYVTGDDPAQAARARALIDRNDVFVASTVLLETEWVLRSAYKFPPARLADALMAFAGLLHVKLENPEGAAQALAWMRSGFDFADALHLALTEHCEAFVSFDVDFVKAARTMGDARARLA
jgi:predicted nucleic acid-binding protein